MIALIIVGVVILLIVFWGISTYNNLVKLKKMAEKAWKDIDIQLQQRFDLIPNLVNTVKGYMKHEGDTLTKIAQYRSSYNNAQTVDEKAKVAGEFDSTLSRLLVTVESYPELKANSNFLSLQDDLKETEAKIAYTRQFYNDAATKYNLLTETVPSNIIASMFKFTSMTLFEVTSEEAKHAVNVDFDN